MIVRAFNYLRAGFRWWMLPLLVLLLGMVVGLGVLASLSAVAPTRYTAF